jgi:hypothetical protein
MTVAPHPRFIAKVDFRPGPPCLFPNHRILLPPLPYSFRILLHRPEQGALTRQPQLLQQPPHTRQTQFQLKLLPQQNPDHLPGPQRKLEPELQGTLARHCLIQPPHLCRLDLQWTPLQRAGFQRTPTAGTVPDECLISRLCDGKHNPGIAE